MTDPDPTRTADAVPMVLRPDLPTRAGIDPDHPLAAGLCGRDGPSIAHLGDLEALLPEDEAPLEIAGGVTGPWLLALRAALAERRGQPPAALRGALCSAALTGSSGPARPVWSRAAALDLEADTLSWTRRALPGLRGARLAIPRGTAAGLTLALASALRAGLALLAATARREKRPHLLAAADGIEFVMPGDDASHRAAGVVLSRLWQELLAERHGHGFARRGDLVIYRPDPDMIDPVEVPTTAMLRAALDHLEAADLAPAEVPPPPARPTGAAEPRGRAEALRRWRQERDGNAVQKALLALREAAKRGINVMGPSVACAKAGVTTGEWASVLTGALPAAAPLFDDAAILPDAPEIDAARAALAQAARGLARPVTLLVARPGLDARTPDAVTLLRAAQGCGGVLRDTGPRRLPADISEAVLRDRPHVLVFCLVSPQSAAMAIETMRDLRQAGFGSFPALGLVECELQKDDLDALSQALPVRFTKKTNTPEFLFDLAKLVTLRNTATQ